MKLHLTLKKKWFQMILSGEKTEEYREIKKYWRKLSLNNYETIVFRNGYCSNVPEITIECLGHRVGVGVSEWGAPETHVHILSLGKILDVKTIK